MIAKAFADLLAAVTDLLKVKSLMTLAIIGATVYLAISGMAEVAVFMAIASSITTYYFTKENGDKEKDELHEKINKLEKLLLEQQLLLEQKERQLNERKINYSDEPVIVTRVEK